MITCLEMGVLLCCTDGFQLPESKAIFLLQPSWKLRLYAHGHASSLLMIFSGCTVVQESIAEGSEGKLPRLLYAAVQSSASRTSTKRLSYCHLCKQEPSPELALALIALH